MSPTNLAKRIGSWTLVFSAVAGLLLAQATLLTNAKKMVEAARELAAEISLLKR